jgi:hypothetical protein
MDKRVTLAEALEEAHRALRMALRELDEALHAPQGTDPGEVGRQLGMLREQLTEHFRLEEEDGYMAPVLEREPHLERTVAHLHGEHRTLADTLDGLIAEARTRDKLEDRLREHVRAWVDQVRQHEARENRLVQDTFNLDIDAED